MPPKKGKGKKNKGKKAAAPAAAKRVNPSLAPGVTRFSRSAINKKKGAYKVKAANGGKWPSTPAKAKPAPADPAAAGRFYTTEDKPRPMKSTKANRNPTKLKAGLTPGTILILLSGPHRGKRVVFLGSLPSGLLLITGPFALNGCPVRRVNQVYVIVTSTKVDVSSVNTSKFTDAYFAKDASAKKKKSGDDFTEQEETAKEVPAERKADQAACDGKIGGLDADMSLYLKSRFSLSKGQYPHLMKF